MFLSFICFIIDLIDSIYYRFYYPEYTLEILQKSTWLVIRLIYISWTWFSYDSFWYYEMFSLFTTYVELWISVWEISTTDHWRKSPEKRVLSSLWTYICDSYCIKRDLLSLSMTVTLSGPQNGDETAVFEWTHDTFSNLLIRLHTSL